MREMEVSLFGSNGLKLLLHFGQINRLGLQQGQHIQPQRGQLGMEPNHLLGVRVQDRADLGALLVRELELLRQPVEVLLEAHALALQASLLPAPAVLVFLVLLLVVVGCHD
jgi:hypothetical protein